MELRIEIPDELAAVLRRTPEELGYDLRLRALVGLVERGLISSGRALNLKGAKMVLFGATSLVQSVLDHVALDQIIPVVATEQEAIKRLTA